MKNTTNTCLYELNLIFADDDYYANKMVITIPQFIFIEKQTRQNLELLLRKTGYYVILHRQKDVWFLNRYVQTSPDMTDLRLSPLVHLPCLLYLV